MVARNNANSSGGNWWDNARQCQSGDRGWRRFYLRLFGRLGLCRRGDKSRAAAIFALFVTFAAISPISRAEETATLSSFDQAVSSYESGDYANALIKAKMAAIGGNTEAQVMVGYILSHGLAGAKDTKSAVEWYLKAAREGNTDAMLALGKLALEGSGGLSANDAFKWLEKAADMGRADAMIALSDMYRLGKGTPPNPAKAAEWLEKSVNYGNALAPRKLGDQYFAKQPKKALHYYEQAAKAGDTEAAYIAGMMYLENLDIRPDSQKAAILLKQAAEGGIAAAQADYGLMVYQGNNVPRDIQAAARWFEKAAKGGDAEGQFLYAFTLAKGEGVKQDFEEAYYWLLVAEKTLKAAGITDYDRTQAELKKRLEDNVDPATLARARKRALAKL